MKKISKICLVSLFVFFVISTFLLIQIFWHENQQKFLEIVFLDVGQGDAIYIETPNGFKTLIDTGPNSMVVRSVAKHLPFYDKSIDLLLVTHSDSDHVGGAVEVLKRFEINSFVQNSVVDNDALNTEIQKMIDEEKIDQYFLKSGDKIILDHEEEIYLEILWPPDDHEESDNNDNSIVARLVYGEVRVMLTGDASLEIEEKIINALKNKKYSTENDYLQSDILKAGHHGSKTSTSLNFLQVTNPEFIIISAGKDNRFGHPHQEVLNNIEEYNKNKEQEEKIKTLETSVLGSIHFESDGESVWLVD
ncbi:MBL fold metallo-hydrolase [Candidatus Parcubacteria bacterium]|nr:MBL fold metallo-hydrolase [Candidatus Parcubacteria bacterium]